MKPGFLGAILGFISFWSTLSCAERACQMGDPFCDREATVTLLLNVLPSTLGGSALGILKTGQSICFDTAGSSYSCPLVGYPRQDGELQQGRSRQFALTFDQYIYERVTGLSWQRCQQGYTASGCATPEPQTTFTLTEANIQCSARGEGWRLPTIQELATIMDSGRASPAYDSLVFPGGGFSDPFWSATADTVNAGSSFVLSFDLGVLTSQPDGNSNAVRCVRGPVHASSHPYTNPGDYSVQDTSTGLVWQKCTRGYSILPNCTADGGGTSATWQEALSYCQGLNLDGRTWRLPNRNELHSLLDYTRSVAPRINADFFPGPASGAYWTSTTTTSLTNQAWTVDFDSAIIALNGKGSSGPLVRCVSGP